MKKILQSLILITVMSTASPCDKQFTIKKAFVVVESVLRRSKDTFVDFVDADHALRLYYKEFRDACDECQYMANLVYHDTIERLERIFSYSSR